ncbi:MAG: extracellular solute-binding protein [Clostridiales bacterium]|nr:extracellular solute-binding protein [Clostridiales bacterium]
MKRTLAMILMLLMLVTMVPAMAEADPITLRLWGGVQPEYGYADIVTNFNEQFKDKGIQLEYIRYVNDADGNLQLDTYLMSGGEVDIFMGYGGTGRLFPRVDAGNVLDMTPYFEAAGFDPIAELGAAAVEQYIYNDKYYAVPTKYENSRYWFANVEMFEAAGIELPYGGWTYEEFLTAIEKLTYGEGMDKVYGMFWNYNKFKDMINVFLTAMNGVYGDYTDEKCESVNTVNTKAALEIVMKSIENGWAPEIEIEVADDLSLPTFFLEGKAAITPCISQIRIIKDIETYPHDFTTAIIPCPVPADMLEEKGSHSYVNGAGDLICVSSKTEYPQECMDFVLWYIQGGMAPLAKGGRIPLWKGFDGQAVADSLMEGAEGVFAVDSILNYMSIDKTAATKAVNLPKYAQNEISTLKAEAIEAVLYGQKDIESAMNEFETKANKMIADAIAAKG